MFWFLRCRHASHCNKQRRRRQNQVKFYRKHWDTVLYPCERWLYALLLSARKPHVIRIYPDSWCKVTEMLKSAYLLGEQLINN